MRTERRKFTLRSALSDLLISILMAADNVDRQKLEAMLLRIAEQITPSLSPPAQTGFACRA
jgi:hypothetical protein